MDTFETVARAAHAELEVKRSVFHAWVFPAADAGQVRQRVDALRAEHPKARHVCSAYRIQLPAPTAGSDDDGEPGGTAGRPMLDVLEREGLGDVGAAVVRYFGGVLLGAGGLIRAYREATALAVRAATRVACVPADRYLVRAGYPQAQALEGLAHRRGWAVVDQRYGADVELEIAVPRDEGARFADELRSAFSGRLAAERVGAATLRRASPEPGSTC